MLRCEHDQRLEKELMSQLEQEQVTNTLCFMCLRLSHVLDVGVAAEAEVTSSSLSLPHPLSSSLTLLLTLSACMHSIRLPHTCARHLHTCTCHLHTTGICLVGQVNERDAAHLVYEAHLEEERAVLHGEVERMLDSALLMQTWLLGDGHPSVTDTMMITVHVAVALGFRL